MKMLWLQAGVLCALIGFLLWKQRQRIQAARRAAAARPGGHGFEATEIKTRLDHWRALHQTDRPQPRRHTPAHEEFAATVRASLLRFGFFRELNEPKPTQAERESPAHQ